MKISFKLLILWATSLAFFAGTGVAVYLALDLMQGVSGLVIRFFLGYCSIIVVAQVFSALVEIRQLFNNTTAGKHESIRGLLRG